MEGAARLVDQVVAEALPADKTGNMKTEPRTATMTALETDRLAELIQRKHACLVELPEMGRKQLDLIRGGEINELLDVLVCKQRRLEDLQTVEKALDPFRAQAPEKRRWRSIEARQCCADQLVECETLLADIVAQEKQGESELTRRRDETAVRLHGAHAAREARGAYRRPLQNPLHQLDITSESP